MKSYSRTLLRTLCVVTMMVLLVGCGAGDNGNGGQQPLTEEQNQVMQDPYYTYTEGVTRTYDSSSLAVVETEKGVMVIELYDGLTPITVENFKSLANAGFYNGLTFHLVQPGFVAQTGDPTGLGNADSGTEPIQLEVNPGLEHSHKGVVGMARVETEPNSATSQFYITLAAIDELDRKYAIFGEVVSGLDVLDRLEVKDLINVVKVFESDNLLHSSGLETTELTEESPE